MNTIRFNTADQGEFFKILRKRVNGYFKENNISKYANWNMRVKTLTMLTIYFLPLVLILTGVMANFWLVLLMWFVMGLGMAGIGLSVMHDANHGAYSKNQKVNKFLGNMINFIGGNAVNWKIQHNVLHHTYTNVHGHDEDIESGALFRLSPEQKRRKLHKFQVYYAWFVYGMMTLYWFSAKDFEQLKRFNKRDLLKGQGTRVGIMLPALIVNKIWYLILLIVLPMLLSEVSWWQSLIGFGVMHFVCGLFLALIFQTAHVMPDTDFPVPDEEGNMKNNWAIHQLYTTANFAQNSRILSWYIGGLNYQIEHHLFPNICHVHYKSISKIVKDTASEFGLPYHSQKTFFGAVIQHFSHLNTMGKPA